MDLHKRWRLLLIVAGIGAVIFLIATFHASRPRLHSSASDWTGLIQAASGLVTAVSGFLGAIGAFGKPAPGSAPKTPTRFRQVSRNYDGDDIVLVEVYDGRDGDGRRVFRVIECRPIE